MLAAAVQCASRSDVRQNADLCMLVVCTWIFVLFLIFVAAREQVGR